MYGLDMLVDDIWTPGSSSVVQVPWYFILSTPLLKFMA